MSDLASVYDGRDFFDAAHEDEQISPLVGRILLINQLQDPDVGSGVQLGRVGALLHIRDGEILERDWEETSWNLNHRSLIVKVILERIIKSNYYCRPLTNVLPLRYEVAPGPPPQQDLPRHLSEQHPTG